MCQRKELLPPPPHPQKNTFWLSSLWTGTVLITETKDLIFSWTLRIHILRWGRKTALPKVMENKLFFNAAPNMPWGITRCCIFYILLCHIVSATSLHTLKSSNMAGFTLDTSSPKNMGVIFCHGIKKKKRIIIMQLLPCRSRAPKRFFNNMILIFEWTSPLCGYGIQMEDNQPG